MANELTITTSMAFEKGNTSDALAETIIRSVAGSHSDHRRQTIGTTEEPIDIGADVGAGGYIKLINRDPLNFISIRRATAEGNMMKLLPGDVALFRLHEDSPAPFAIADTADCQLEFLIIEA